MLNLDINRQELMAQVPYLRMVESQRFTWDELGTALNAEVQGAGATASALGKAAPAARGFLQDLWTVVKQEVHTLLCTNARKYAALRKTLREKKEIGTLYVLTTVTAFLAGIVGVAPALLTPLVATVLFAVAQLGQNVWCEMMKKSIPAKKAAK